MLKPRAQVFYAVQSAATAPVAELVAAEALAFGDRFVVPDVLRAASAAAVVYWEPLDKCVAPDDRSGQAEFAGPRGRAAAAPAPVIAMPVAGLRKVASPAGRGATAH